jgi:hypothetical protein
MVRLSGLSRRRSSGQFPQALGGPLSKLALRVITAPVDRSLVSQSIASRFTLQSLAHSLAHSLARPASLNIPSVFPLCPLAPPAASG